MISSLSAAKTLCELSDWSLSNLKIQKILYIAHMYALGRTDGECPLLSENFEAWDYGPVLPQVYQKGKIFGADAVGNVFHSIGSIFEGEDRETLAECYVDLGDRSAAELVAATHWKLGAWAKHYSPSVKGIIIPNGDILDEYRKRKSRGPTKKSSAPKSR